MPRSVYIAIIVLAWILFCSIPIFFLGFFSKMHLPGFTIGSFLFIFFVKNIKFILFYYLNSLWLIPRFFDKGHFSKYFTLLAICFIAVASVPFITEKVLPPHGHHKPGHMPPSAHEININKPAPPFHKHRAHKRPFSADTGMHFFMTIIIGMLPLMLHVYRKWIHEKKEKAEMELAFLKSQINHHFLFNSLNSIYALSEGKSELTSPAILDLSAIMRYLLQDTPKSKVPLSDELNYIDHFINLQKYRLAENVKLIYEVEGKPESNVISPMLMLTFIENCFKHGVSTIKKSIIRIEIEIQNNILELRTENSIFKSNGNKNVEGLGINNALKRLKHDYNGKFSLSNYADGDMYKVHLKLELK